MRTYIPTPQDANNERAYSVFTVDQNSGVVHVSINDVPVEMELDTGAAVSLISTETYHSIMTKAAIAPLEKTNIVLKTYTGQSIPVLGTTTIKARYENQEADLAIIVVDGEGPNLMGRNWIRQFCARVGQVHNLAF